jgi:putative radical SAM enzyme (TIGR03279 family)
MKVVSVEPESVAADLGIQPGDDVMELNGKRVLDPIDFRFREVDPDLELKVSRDGEVTIFEIEKDEGEPLGIELEEMKILSCGNDCIFCFVDQNPKGLRDQLYFRDGDYRLSFMYGNYTTMTNAGPAILRRIIDQRLSPQYISVHVTDTQVRAKMMGLHKDDFILQKIKLLHDNGIDMHTQIVLCPGLNDGEFLEKTVMDLYKYRKRIVSLAVVPVGLTDHRWGLAELKNVDKPYAIGLLDRIDRWQARFRKAIGRGFVYASDEFYITAGRDVPPAKNYDGFPQTENGVGMVRSFLLDYRRQAKDFPKRLAKKKKLTLVTGELAAGMIREHVIPRLEEVGGLEVSLVVAPNTLFGRKVTVSGLLSGKCLYSALEGRENGHMVLLPPDLLNADGMFLDNETPASLATRLGTCVMVFTGRWDLVFATLKSLNGEPASGRSIPKPDSRSSTLSTSGV